MKDESGTNPSGSSLIPHPSSFPCWLTSRAVIRRRLLAWFRKNARPLPWRTSRDPYRIWISEVMLQQTQVVTVVSYFERFLERFPTLTRLAQADEQEVLRLWEGLGYYRRARDLCRAARLLSESAHRTIPDDPEFVGTLPGFGRYTVNAVLSQAYDRRLPILEANSQRVLCRLFGIEQNPRESAVRNTLWQLAETLLPARSVGDFNQAMMELGALVCTPAKPNCVKCPLSEHCRAKLQNRQEEIPFRAKRADIVAVEEIAVIVRRGDRLLLVQRPDQGRWAKMWEFPHQSRDSHEPPKVAARRLLAALDVEGRILGELATIRHNVTRFQITMVCWRVKHRRGSPRAPMYPNAAWVRAEDLHAYPLSTPQRRLARFLSEPEA
jgi:A/G-specific adenine glycosylase